MTDNRYIGKSVKRIEDLPLLQGRSRFVDDLQFPDMLEAAFVRSPHGHALIHGIDVRAARQAPGVHAVYTLADLAPLLSQERIPLQFRTAQLPADITQFVLAKDEVAFVGEAVAVVIAETRYHAEDAAALVAVDYEPLPAISDCRQALAPGAPVAHRGKSSNLMHQFRQSYGDVAAAFARAAHRAGVKLKQHRGGAHSIEGRGVRLDHGDQQRHRHRDRQLHPHAHRRRRQHQRRERVRRGYAGHDLDRASLAPFPFPACCNGRARPAIFVARHACR